MTTAIKSAISPFAQPKPEPNTNGIRFLDEKLASVPASGIPENFRKLSRFFPMIVLVPTSAVEDEETQKKLQSRTNLLLTSPTQGMTAYLWTPRRPGMEFQRYKHV